MDKVSPVFLRLLWPAEALAPLFLFMALTTVAATMSPSPAPSPAPTPTPTPTPATFVITEAEFNELLPYHDSKDCPANGFYTYSAFIAATKAFPNFGTVGDLETRRREMAAFFAQVAQETYSGCYISETGGGWYCTWSIWPCLLGRKYFGRGPLQLRWNYNYGYAGLALREFLLVKPDLVSSNASLSFETAIWLWMTQHSWKIPSCHDAILGKWKPTSADETAGRRPGFGVTTNILLSVNGKEEECGRGKNQAQESRISHYENYCLKLGVSAGDNVDCSNQTQFSNPSALQLHSTHAAVL